MLMFSIKLEPIEEEVPLFGAQTVSYSANQPTVKCEWSLKGSCACADGNCEDCQASEKENDEKDNILTMTFAAASPLNRPDPNVCTEPGKATLRSTGQTDERMPPDDTGTCDSEEDDSDNSDTETASEIETDEPGSGKKKGSPPIAVNDSDVSRLSRRSFPCGQCEKAFASRQSVRRHEATFHNTGIGPYVCSTPNCGKAFGSKGALEMHSLYHSTVKPFTCDTCGAAFTQKGNLKVHQRKHSDERPYTCAVCLKGFKCKWYLVHHNLTHSGSKPFTCADCGSSFTQKSILERHRQGKIPCVSRYTPSESRPFSCTVEGCGKAFRLKGNLVEHLHTHSGAKEFKCTVCGRTFTCRGGLTKHRRKIHGS